MSDGKTYDYNTYTYYEDSVEENIDTGTRAYDSVQSCQYWVKGLSARCKNWDEDTRKCKYDIIDGEPSGYNFSNCDYLGRNYLCDKYAAGEDEDLTKYWCVLPDIFLSGVGKRERDKNGNLTSNVVLTAVPVSDIKGYCNGRCDEHGRGTGCTKPRTGDPDKDAVVCNYYRPWQMGFGATEPRPLEIKYIDGERIITDEAIQEAYSIVDEPMGLRLPFSFKIYNNRGRYQKCLYWDDEYAAVFDVDSNGIKIVDVAGNAVTPATLCTNTNEHARAYSELLTGTDANPDWLLENVWCQGKTVVCNGAKPECPCYTGKWVFCTDEKMMNGMRITADQILEMRFWARNWASQDEYDSYFKNRPNFLDTSSSEIFTFTKWNKLDADDASKSIMEGKRVKLCVPSPVNKRDFNKEEHIIAEDIKYLPLLVDGGTTAPSQNQVYYTSLVRDIEILDHKPFDVMYPYATNDPWAAEVCKPLDQIKSCVKRGVSLNGDKITAVGATLQNCSVYLINLSRMPHPSESFGFIYDMLTTYLNISEISDEYPKVSSGQKQDNYTGMSERVKFYMEIENFLNYFEKQDPSTIATSSADSEGYFKISSVDLNYNLLNQIIVLVKFSDSTWDFRKIPVWAQLYGGAIIQTSFTAGEVGNLPNRFGESSIQGKVATITPNSVYGTSITLDELIPVVNHEYATLFSYSFEYSYCIKKVKVSNEVINNWGRIGNTSKVWVELDDINVNHLFEWGITDAKMVNIAQEEAEQNGEAISGGCDDSSSVKMKRKDIETWVSGGLSVPAAALVLEPNDGKPRGFFNGDYRLEISYWYKKFANDNTAGDNEEIVWPNFSSPNIKFVAPSTQITLNDPQFTIEKIKNESVAVMAFFKDETGRKVSCMATKLMVWAPNLSCRNVEIDYRYEQPSNWYKLLPETNIDTLAIPPTKEQLQGSYGPRRYRPPCGDHKNGNTGEGVGAMWYPFINCSDNDFYRAYAGGSFCTNYYPGIPRDDMRFCGPIKYTAWVAGGGGSAFADCVLPYHYRFSVTTGEAFFAGYANIVAYCDSAEYAAHNWMMPPFGNKGREYVEKWLSRDYWPHMAYNAEIPYIKKEWVPLVPDKEDFFLSFNAFEQTSETTSDTFSFTSQLHFMLSTNIEETLSVDSGAYSRLRFEDVYDVRTVIATSYPLPLVDTGLTSVAAFYYFKESTVAWAWREFWKDIEYITDRSLFFINYTQPEYQYSYNKKECRFICDEKSYKITYTKPVVEGGDLKKYPSVKLGSGHERYFEIRYNEYDDTYIDWKDEDDGNVGDTGGSIYETTTGGDWVHGTNVLFDSNAVESYPAADAAGCKIQYEGDDGPIDKYFNRGLNALIKRANLKYLPFEESEGEGGFDKNDTDKAVESIPEGQIPSMGLPGDITCVWYNVSPTLTITPPDPTESGASEVCISKIFIKSKWGWFKPSPGKFNPDYLNNQFNLNLNNKTYNAWPGYEICKPGVTVTIESAAGAEVVFECAPIAYNKDLHKDMGLVDYEIDIPVSPSVNRMFYKPDTAIKIKFTGAEGQFMVFDAASYACNYANYKDDTEIIFVYERRYFVSTGKKFGNYNVDGPKVEGNFLLQYNFDFENSGIYFAASPRLAYVPDGAFTAKDKIRAIYTDKQYREDTSLPITINNIDNIEKTEQKKLYESAYNKDTDGDTMSFSIITPPHIATYLEDNKMGLLIGANGMATFKATLDVWDDHPLVKQYKAGKGMWYPKGHKFQWSKNVTRMTCYEYVYGSSAFVLTLFNVMEVDFIHMDYLTVDVPTDPLTALYANRMEYQIEVAQKLFGDDVGFENAGRILGTAGTFVDPSVNVVT